MNKFFNLQKLAHSTVRKYLLPASLLANMAGVCMPSAQAAAAVALTSGISHNCALTTAGGAMCWGYNFNGQLGTNNQTNSSQPINVVGLTSGVTAIAAGQYHTCALIADGTVKCWGSGGNGQLGLGAGNLNNRYYPTTVPGLTGVAAIAAGYSRTCAVMATGNAKCWGNGAMGDGTGGATNPTLHDVIGVTGVVAIAVGMNHTCALTNAKIVQCWGNNNLGQLGNNTTTAATTRVNVSGLTDAVAISAGQDHTCAKTSAGAVLCWGANTVGQIGNGSNTNVLVPTPVTGLSSGVTALATSNFGSSSCAVLASGTTKCWGSNLSGKLGNGNTANQNTPVSVTGLAGNANAIILNQSSACAQIQASVQCWGDNTYGQIGMGSTTQIPFPVNVIGLAGTAPPGIPAPISPVTSNTPTYTWKAMPGATAYRLNVNGSISTYTAAAAACDGGIGLCKITGTTLTPGAYTWYIQGFNDYGSSVWSAGTSFTL